MMTTKTKVRSVPTGSIVETILFGAPSGSYYRVSDMVRSLLSADGTRLTDRYAYTRFTDEKVKIHADNECRIIDPTTIDGFRS